MQRAMDCGSYNASIARSSYGSINICGTAGIAPTLVVNSPSGDLNPKLNPELEESECITSEAKRLKVSLGAHGFIDPQLLCKTEWLSTNAHLVEHLIEEGVLQK